ncbi:MAG: hypothetical protein EAZ87_08105 [Nostocales cyanobacterium]|nr:MAG: hypothetical protein EAZ87_08105 [Nostocales cyanobacterium]
MIVIILIIGQLILIAIALKIIFSLIDKMIYLCRRKGLLPRYWQNPTKISAIRKSEKVNNRRSKIERKAIKISGSSTSWKKLVSLLHGDTATAERLIAGLMLKFPGKSDRWYIEKAIYDLDRDRRRG